jgi:hypothetical protein
MEPIDQRTFLYEHDQGTLDIEELRSKMRCDYGEQNGNKGVEEGNEPSRSNRLELTESY